MLQSLAKALNAEHVFYPYHRKQYLGLLDASFAFRSCRTLPKPISPAARGPKTQRKPDEVSDMLNLRV